MRKEMKKWMSYLCFSVLLVLAMVIISPMTASAAKISSKKATLFAGEKKELKLSGAKGKVKWKSSKKAVATVDQNGIITAKKTGKCTITAKNSGKTYQCKITVKKLPKNYALLNGKRVKVGKTCTITYTVKAKKKIAEMRLWYYYNRKAVQVLNIDDGERFSSFPWVCNMSWPDLIENGKIYESYQLWGLDKKNPYYPMPVSCSKAKVFDKIKVKVLKTGVYKFKASFEFWGGGSDRPAIKGVVKETIK